MKKIMVFLTVSILSSSCATIFTGTKQNVQISSTPPGAKIAVNGIDRGITPALVSLKKGNGTEVITLSHEGYEDKTFQPEHTFQPVAILNLFGILGWGIDAVTGALWKYDPSFYNIELKPKK